MSKSHICPKCGNTVIKETTIADYAFVCWFCDENFYSFEVIAVERELSHGSIQGELRKHLGKFIKQCGVQAQIKILQKAFFEYENFCGQEKLNTYSSAGLNKFIRSVQNWNNFFERISASCQLATAVN